MSCRRTFALLRQVLQPDPLLRRDRNPRSIVPVVDDRHVGQEVRESAHEELYAPRAVVVRKRALAEDLAVLDPDRPGRVDDFLHNSDALAEDAGLEGAVHEEVLVDEVELVDQEDLVRFREGVPAGERSVQVCGIEQIERTIGQTPLEDSARSAACTP